MSFSRIAVLFCIAALLVVGCDSSGTPPVSSEAPSPVASSSEIQELMPVQVPPSVFVGFNDAVAFYADDAYAPWAEIDVSPLREQHEFSSIRVWAVDATGRATQVPVTTDGEGSDARFFVEPSADTRYLAYADLGVEVQRTYRALCTISGVRLGFDSVRDDVPRICTQILCEQDFYESERLFAENEEMTIHEEKLYETGYPAEPFGGFGLSGNVCEECLRDDAGPSLFYPVARCSDRKLLPPVQWKDPGEVIVWSPLFPETVFFDSYDPAQPREEQVYQTKNGFSPTLVSQAAGANARPDVSHAEKKVIWNTGIWNSPASHSAPFLVDRFTGTETAVTGATADLHAQPRWNNMEAYKEQIVFARENSSGSIPETELWVMNEDGSGLRQLTDRSERVRRDTTGFDVWNGTTLLYANREESTPLGIYAKSMTDAPDEAGRRIDECEVATAPVVSHDQTMVAYFCGYGSQTTVRVVQAGNWGNVLHEFPSAVGGYGQSLLDFSGNDQYLYLEREPYPTASIFRVKLDGSNPVRITPSTTVDTHSSVLPSYAVEVEEE